MKKYAIMINGYGNRRRYCIVEVIATGTNPTDGKSYKSEEAARAAAESLGIKIEGVGDLWEIMEYGRA